MAWDTDSDFPYQMITGCRIVTHRDFWRDQLLPSTPERDTWTLSTVPNGRRRADCPSFCAGRSADGDKQHDTLQTTTLMPRQRRRRCRATWIAASQCHIQRRLTAVVIPCEYFHDNKSGNTRHPTTVGQCAGLDRGCLAAHQFIQRPNAAVLHRLEHILRRVCEDRPSIGDGCVTL
jgi:hypothetical protein